MMTSTMLALMVALMAELTGPSGSHEFFDGSLDGDRLTLVSEAGVSCQGIEVEDRVPLSCSDGRTGYVTFFGSVGRGYLDGQPLVVVPS